MRIIISPAKKMRDDEGLLADSLPQFLPETHQILEALRAMTYEERKALWGCSEALAREADGYLQRMDPDKGRIPALMAYVGLQYQHLAARVAQQQELDWLEEHLRILSGLYGVLRPMDGVMKYRLEMQAKLSVAGSRDLYDFWGGRLARNLADETDLVVDLASVEYSRAVLPHLPPETRRLQLRFLQPVGGRLREKGTLSKIARGEMVQYLAVHQVEDPEKIKDFDWLGYRYDALESGPDCWVFRGPEAE